MLLDSHVISSVLAALMLIGFYIFPSALAYLRHHHNFAAICATNLLVGWTLIGWVAALIWALTKPAPQPAPVKYGFKPRPGTDIEVID
jgi:hypothetical protein